MWLCHVGCHGNTVITILMACLVCATIPLRIIFRAKFRFTLKGWRKVKLLCPFQGDNKPYFQTLLDLFLCQALNLCFRPWQYSCWQNNTYTMAQTNDTKAKQSKTYSPQLWSWGNIYDRGFRRGVIWALSLGCFQFFVHEGQWTKRYNILLKK